MGRLTMFTLIVLLFSCKDDDEPSALLSVQRASFFCAKSVSEMTWFRELVESAESDPALIGNIYVGTYEGAVVFIHQPMVMSCLACVIYDCDGNKLDTSTMDHEKLRLLMDNWHLVHSAY